MTIIWLFIFVVKRIREISFSGLDRNKPTYQLHQLPSAKPAEAAGESKFFFFFPVIYINSYPFQTLRAISASWPKRTTTTKKMLVCCVLGGVADIKRGDVPMELIVLVLMRTFCTTRQCVCGSWEIWNRCIQVNSITGKSRESDFEYFGSWQNPMLWQKLRNNSAFSLISKEKARN